MRKVHVQPCDGPLRHNPTLYHFRCWTWQHRKSFAGDVTSKVQRSGAAYRRSLQRSGSRIRRSLFLAPRNTRRISLGPCPGGEPARKRGSKHEEGGHNTCEVAFPAEEAGGTALHSAGISYSRPLNQGSQVTSRRVKSNQVKTGKTDFWTKMRTTMGPRRHPPNLSTTSNMPYLLTAHAVRHEHDRREFRGRVLVVLTPNTTTTTTSSLRCREEEPGVTPHPLWDP